MNNTTIEPQDIPGHGRIVTGILIHTVFVSATTLVAAHHLARLRKQPRHVSFYQILATTLIPTFAMADASIAAYRTLKVWQRNGWDNATRYYVSAALDVRAISTTLAEKERKEEIDEKAGTGAYEKAPMEVTIPLHLIPYQNLEPQVNSYDAIWFGKIITLLIFSFFALFNEVLWIRRARHGARSFIDDYVAVTALSGLLIALQSIGIMILDTTWRAPERYISKFQKHCIEPSPADLFLDLAWLGRLVELHAASVTAICLESMMFFTSQYGFNGNVLHYGALCDSREMRERTERRTRAPKATSEGLDFEATKQPRPCHSWVDGGIDRVTATFADVGYIFAFILALTPILYAMRCLKVFYVLCVQKRNDDKSKREVNWTHIFRGSSGYNYVCLTFSLICIAVWEITSPEAWEPWMWRDPWSNFL